MYSVVLMMAIAGGSEAPDHGLRGGGGGGCYGGGYGGCYGGGYGGCYGGGYGGGCYGGGYGGCYGGGYGGCYGGGYGGCYGGGYGGGYGGCYGGGYGGCYGGGYGGCYGGGYGGCYGGTYAGCYGGGYGMGCYGGVISGGTYPAGTVVPGGKPPEDVKKMPKPETGTKPPEETFLAPDAAPATLVVSLPADAKLTIDDNPTASTSERRVFVTPSLKMGKEYHYSLKAEVVRDGKPVVIEKVVAVKPGEQTQVTLSVPTTTVAAR
jgi:uncharacterized protein (TIGR03000 family)